VQQGSHRRDACIVEQGALAAHKRGWRLPGPPDGVHPRTPALPPAPQNRSHPSSPWPSLTMGCTRGEDGAAPAPVGAASDPDSPRPLGLCGSGGDGGRVNSWRWRRPSRGCLMADE